MNQTIPSGVITGTQVQEVFKLAKHLSIIESIQQAAPTDGLWGDDRTDEDQLGATYPELEWAMGAFQSHSSTTSFSERQKEVFEIFKKHHLQNQHKTFLPKDYLEWGAILIWLELNCIF